MKLTFLCFLIIPSILFAAPPVILEEGKGEYPLGLYLDLLEDEEGKWTIEDVVTPTISKKFKPSRKESPSFGFTNSAIWVRFELQQRPERNKSWLLEIGWPQLDHVEFYWPEENGNFTVKKTGKQYPFHTRDIKHRHFIFDLPSITEASKVVYLRLTSDDTLQIPITIWSIRVFNQVEHERQYVLGIYYGIMFVMLFYNLFIFFSVRDLSYMFYVIYVSNFILWQMGINGIDYEYLWPNNVWFTNRSIPLFIGGASFGIYGFIITFLQTRKHIPILHNLLLFMAGASIVQIGLSLMIAPQLSTQIGVAYALLSVIVSILVGIKVLLKGYRPARFFLIAFLALLAGITLISLYVFGVLPKTFITLYGVQIGSSLEVTLLSLGLADRINLMKGEREKAMKSQLQEYERNIALTHSYERFVPKDFLNLLKKESILEVELGDQIHNNMSILFSDIRSFTTLSESMTPQENFNFLNAYLKRMEPSITKNKGIVDKFIGDAIMALFPKRTDDALLAAISMQVAITEYNGHRKKKGYVPIKTGIGINTGDMMLGTIGAHNRMEGTVISDTVNLGARIEGMTKMYGASILISENTFHQLENPEQFALRVIDQVVVKGKTKPVTVFEVFNGDVPEIRNAKLSTSKLYEQAVSTYYMKDFEEALSMFQKCLDQFSEDKVAQIYINRCEHYLKVGWDETWDGVERLESK